MKERNYYKMIVIGAAVCLVLANLVRFCREYQRAQQYYRVTIARETELTEDMVSELQKLTGIRRFEAIASVPVTIELEGYTLHTELMGIDLMQPSLKWERTEEVFLGDMPILFWGTDCFSAFVDANGRAPGKGQITEWIETYRALSITITTEDGTIQKAGIGGILKEPQGNVYMQQKKMKEIFADSKVTGGHLEIQGYQNTKKAKTILETGGFQVGEPEAVSPPAL